MVMLLFAVVAMLISIAIGLEVWQPTEAVQLAFFMLFFVCLRASATEMELEDQKKVVKQLRDDISILTNLYNRQWSLKSGLTQADNLEDALSGMSDPEKPKR